MSLLKTLGRFLWTVEEVSHDHAGSFQLLESGSGEPLGTVMVEKGRLCWATARESTVRLGQLIARETGLDPPRLQELYAHCRDEGVPFGECLVSRGLLESDALRRLLLSQIVGALSVLLRAVGTDRGRWSEWSPATVRTYAPTFTFSAPEVVTAYLAHDVEAALEAPPVPKPFLAALKRLPVALGLLRLETEPPMHLPIGSSPRLELCSQELEHLAGKGRHLLLTPALVAAGVRPHLTFCANETGGLLVARADPYLLVAETASTPDFVSVVTSLRAWRRDVARGG